MNFNYRVLANSEKIIMLQDIGDDVTMSITTNIKDVTSILWDAGRLIEGQLFCYVDEDGQTVGVEHEQGVFKRFVPFSKDLMDQIAACLMEPGEKEATDYFMGELDKVRLTVKDFCTRAADSQALTKSSLFAILMHLRRGLKSVVDEIESVVGDDRVVMFDATSGKLRNKGAV